VGFMKLTTVLVLGLAACSHSSTSGNMKRGQQLVSMGGCADCHTPKRFDPKLGMPVPDMTRFLSGHPEGAPDPQAQPGQTDMAVIGSEGPMEDPAFGKVWARNLTPDKETGIGNWTTEEIVAALQTGIRPDGRMLAPIMPYHAFAHLTKEDVTAIADYLKTIKPVNHAVPGPFGPGQKVPTFVMRIVPPGATAAAAPK